MTDSKIGRLRTFLEHMEDCGFATISHYCSHGLSTAFVPAVSESEIEDADDFGLTEDMLSLPLDEAAWKVTDVFAYHPDSSGTFTEGFRIFEAFEHLISEAFQPEDSYHKKLEGVDPLSFSQETALNGLAEVRDWYDSGDMSVFAWPCADDSGDMNALLRFPSCPDALWFVHFHSSVAYGD